MVEKEFQPIIDRNRHESDAAKVYHAQIGLLTDLVNYGSNLIPHAFESSPKKLGDIIVIGTLLKQVVLMTDAIQVLVAHAACSASILQARAAFEASLCLDWMLAEDLQKKAEYYFVANLRSERMWALRLESGTPEEKTFSEHFKDIQQYLAGDMPGLQAQAKVSLDQLNAILAEPRWSPINAEFEKRRRKFGDAHWYELLGMVSVARLAEDLNRSPEYHLLYSKGSDVMHSASYRDRVFLRPGKVRFAPIRQLADAQLVLRFSAMLAVVTYQSVLKYYMPGELTAFSNRYVSDWRTAFMSTPSVTYGS